MSAEATVAGGPNNLIATFDTDNSSSCTHGCSAPDVLPAKGARTVRASSSPMHVRDAHEGERLAAQALQSGDFSEDSLIRVLACAWPPSQTNLRPKVFGDDAEASYAILGHFCSKTGEGVTVHCQRTPSAVKLVNAFLLQFGLDCSWGSIAIALCRIVMLPIAPSAVTFPLPLDTFKVGGDW